jgi:hypothetical protein
MLRLATPLSAFAIAGASLALAACGSSSNSSSTTGSAAAGGTGRTQNAAFQKYQQCLRDNGVTLPSRGNRRGGSNATPSNTNGTPPQGAPSGTAPSGTAPQGTAPGGGQGGPGFFGGGGANSAKFQKAMRACAKLRPQGTGPGGGYGGFRGGSGNGNGPQQNIRAFTPYLTCLRDKGLDVKVSDGFNALRNLKQSDPKVQAAFKSCQSKIPQRPQGGASGTAPGTTTS